MMNSSLYAALVLFGIAVAPSLAQADADEATLDARLLGGVARFGETAAPDTTANEPLVGVGARLTYSTHNRFSYDAELELAQSSSATYLDRMVETDSGLRTGDLHRNQRLARLEAGLTWRGGVRLIPTAHLGTGLQLRLPGDGSVVSGAGTVGTAVSDLMFDVTVTGGVGFDYRFGRSTVVGIGARVTRAFPLGGTDYASAEVFVQWSHHWYPRLF